jgi:hypothetical protein
LAPPRRSPATALLWKQWRESFPLATLGAGAVLAISVILWLALNPRDWSGESTGLVRISGAVWIMTGALVALVAGIGLFLEDLRPDVHEFWRSRPIGPDQWFLLKFIPGLLLTIVTLALPMAVVVALALLLAPGGSVPKADLEQGRAIIVQALIGQAAIYCLAAAIMAIVRRPVMTAVVTIITAIGVMIAFESDSSHGEPPINGFMLLCGIAAAVSMLVAWLASTTYDGSRGS